MQEVVILGSTGSIGTQALEVIREHPGRFQVVGLAAGGSNLELFAAQIREFRPTAVALGGTSERIAGELAAALANLLATGTATAASSAPLSVQPITASAFPEILTGMDPVAQLAGSFPQATVLNGITGGVGLTSTLAALTAGARLALANKESLVVGGALVTAALKYPGQITPVDSEHSAIAQALRAGVHEKGLTSPVLTGRSELSEIVLTASGGPFRGKSRAELQEVRAKDALAHPTWQMGPVVTVNSSTLMNKGLELIEAAWLFDVPAEQIVPVIHPQSIIHSAITWQDGATVAQASPPDMKLPIALGLTWPERLPIVAQPLTWREAASWTFEPIDHETFPALQLAKHALQASPTHPAVLNAANEVCVYAFLHDEIRWVQIVETVSRVVGEHEGLADPRLEDVFAVEQWASCRARELLG